MQKLCFFHLKKKERLKSSFFHDQYLFNNGSKRGGFHIEILDLHGLLLKNTLESNIKRREQQEISFLHYLLLFLFFFFIPLLKT